MRSFIDRTQEDLDRVTRRAARAKTDKEISEEQLNRIIRHISEVEEVLKDIEDNG